VAGAKVLYGFETPPFSSGGDADTSLIVTDSAKTCAVFLQNHRLLHFTFA
jgi:hypothetical protein